MYVCLLVSPKKDQLISLVLAKHLATKGFLLHSTSPLLALRALLCAVWSYRIERGSLADLPGAKQESGKERVL